MGGRSVGLSAIEVLILMMRFGFLSLENELHRSQLEIAVNWLHDNSSGVRPESDQLVRVYRTDLWPAFDYDAWFNALALDFVNELSLQVENQKQSELQKKYFAISSVSRVEYSSLICGGFGWPKLLKERFLEKVIVAEGTTEKTGNGILLFGLPGTGKTTIAKTIASEIQGWQFIRLTMADFLTSGRENIYRTIRGVFSDLRSLHKCIVFFDEIELLIPERDGDSPSWDIGTLTNIMLPELQELHDCPLVIPMVATNYISKFDEAGRRPGRFDYILPVGLPTAAERLALLKSVLPADFMLDGIEKVPDKGTIKIIIDWAREFQNRGKKRIEDATTLWNSSYGSPVPSAEALTEFSNDVEKYTYPSDAK